MTGNRALKHNHHLTGFKAITQLRHRCAVARKGDLAPVGQPSHQRVKIPVSRHRKLHHFLRDRGPGPG